MAMIKNLKSTYINCECSSNDHIVALKLIDHSDEVSPEVELYLNVQMQHSHSFFSRAWIALKYVFKSSPCNFGHWNETILEPDTARDIIDTCNMYIDLRAELEVAKS